MQATNKSLDETLRRIRDAAEKGDADAQVELATRSVTGEGVAQDENQATGWFREAADQGFAEAQYYVGKILLSGEGVTCDPIKAGAWLREAADQGFNVTEDEAPH